MARCETRASCAGRVRGGLCACARRKFCRITRELFEEEPSLCKGPSRHKLDSIFNAAMFGHRTFHHNFRAPNRLNEAAFYQTRTFVCVDTRLAATQCEQYKSRVCWTIVFWWDPNARFSPNVALAKHRENTRAPCSMPHQRRLCKVLRAIGGQTQPRPDRPTV